MKIKSKTVIIIIMMVIVIFNRNLLGETDQVEAFMNFNKGYYSPFSKEIITLVLIPLFIWSLEIENENLENLIISYKTKKNFYTNYIRKKMIKQVFAFSGTYCIVYLLISIIMFNIFVVINLNNLFIICFQFILLNLYLLLVAIISQLFRIYYHWLISDFVAISIVYVLYFIQLQYSNILDMLPSIVVSIGVFIGTEVNYSLFFLIIGNLFILLFYVLTVDYLYQFLIKNKQYLD